MTDISLEPGEEIVWQGVMNRGMLLFALIGFLLPIIALGGFFLTQNSVGLSPCTGQGFGPITGQADCIARNPDIYVSGMVLGSIVIVIGLCALFFDYFWQLAKEYIVTSKRVIIKSGLIHASYRSIYFGQIKGVVNSPGWLGRMFGFGTIKIDIGEKYSGMSRNMIRYMSLTNVNAPDEVYQYINTSVAKEKGTSAQQNPQ